MPSPRHKRARFVMPVADEVIESSARLGRERGAAPDAALLALQVGVCVGEPRVGDSVGVRECDKRCSVVESERHPSVSCSCRSQIA